MQYGSFRRFPLPNPNIPKHHFRPLNLTKWIETYSCHGSKSPPNMCIYIYIYKFYIYQHVNKQYYSRVDIAWTLQHSLTSARTILEFQRDGCLVSQVAQASGSIRSCPVKMGSLSVRQNRPKDWRLHSRNCHMNDYVHDFSMFQRT